MRTKFLHIVLLVMGLIALTFSSCIKATVYEVSPSNTDLTWQYTFTEQYNNGDMFGWNYSSTYDSCYGTVMNGYYQLVNYSQTHHYYNLISTGQNLSSSYDVKASMQFDNAMGLMFAASDVNNGYFFYVDAAGYYAVYRIGGPASLTNTIIPATYVGSLISRSSYNSLEVLQSGGFWKGYINGTLVFTTTALAPYGNQFGFGILPATVGYVDYLQINYY